MVVPNICDLSDDLLVEICSRLPCKTAVRCKFISKRFLASISSRAFIERFIICYQTLFQQMTEEDLENEWCLVSLSRHKLLILFLPNIHKVALDLSNPQNQLSLSFLGPQFDRQHEDRIEATSLTSRIVGCSNGLLLCRKSLDDKVYYVCNPVTRDWVQLPPITSIKASDSVFEGFICEPYYSVEGDRVTVRRHHRVRVVLIPCFDGTKSKFEVAVFSSETGRWNTNIVCCPKSFTQAMILLPAVACRGRLYFVGKKSILVYDPFNNECDTLDYPTYSNPINIVSWGHVGLSCGNLRISDISQTTSNIPVSVSVWELKDDGWHLLHRTCLPPLERRNSVRPELGAANHADVRVRVRAFHPYHGDVVFFQHAHRIFVVNLKTNQFKTAGYGIQSLQILPLDLPWWPTPIPSIE